jgi:hypothetical protein
MSRDESMRRCGWGIWLVLAALAGCQSATQYSYLGAGATLYASQAPTNEIEQIYYLGAFDPQDQVPPTIYRVTVRGQSSALSQMKFASGWVQASLIDTLQSRVGFAADSDKTTIDQAAAAGESPTGLKIGRRLMLFGPEGFREAPRDHRLVIVMGASPDKFFASLDQSLGFIQKLDSKGVDPAIARDLTLAAARARADQARLDDLKRELAPSAGS